MTSSDHDASGAVADWLHRTVAGLAPPGAEPPCGCGWPRDRSGDHVGRRDAPDAVRRRGGVLDGGRDSVHPRRHGAADTTAEIVLLDGSAPVRVGWGRHSYTGKTTVPTPVEKPAPFFDPEDHQ